MQMSLGFGVWGFGLWCILEGLRNPTCISSKPYTLRACKGQGELQQTYPFELEAQAPILSFDCLGGSAASSTPARRPPKKRSRRSGLAGFGVFIGFGVPF